VEPELTSSAAGFETVTVGAWRATLIQLGVLELEAEQLLGPFAREATAKIASNVALLEGPSCTVLVDTGGGVVSDWLPGSSCDLASALVAAGSSLGAIDRVVLTHLDFDHAGGIVVGTWPAPLRPVVDVPVLVTAQAVASARRRPVDAPWNSATPVVRALEAAGTLREILPGDEIAAGLLVRDAPGHRSGHVCLELQGAPGQVLLYVSDVVHHPRHVERPDLDGVHDSDGVLALETRLAFLAEAEARDALVGASHLAGWGRVRTVAGDRRWLPLERAA
jgi:glyoxylase-like metal-dependent hydrolase (beta-lactamase superfamily II)